MPNNATLAPTSPFSDRLLAMQESATIAMAKKARELAGSRPS